MKEHVRSTAPRAHKRPLDLDLANIVRIWLVTQWRAEPLVITAALVGCLPPFDLTKDHKRERARVRTARRTTTRSPGTSRYTPAQV